MRKAVEKGEGQGERGTECSLLVVAIFEAVPQRHYTNVYEGPISRANRLLNGKSWGVGRYITTLNTHCAQRMFHLGHIQYSVIASSSLGRLTPKIPPELTLWTGGPVDWPIWPVHCEH